MRRSKDSKNPERRFSAHSNLRHSVAVEAARLLYAREYKEYFQAKREAARRQSTTVLPTNSEIHQQLLILADRLEGQGRVQRLESMRRVALELMEILQEFTPRLIGSVWTGHIRQGSDVDLNIYADEPEGLEDALESALIPFEMERVQSRKAGQEREFLHYHVHHASGIPVEITVYPSSEVHHHPTCSITGGPMARGTLPQLRQLLLENGGSQSNTQSDSPSELAQLLRPLSLEAMEAKLPELTACREVSQNHYHHLDVFDHTLEVVSHLEEFFEQSFAKFEPWSEHLQRHFAQSPVPGWTRSQFLILVALCHDLGKPASWNLHRSGRIQFHGHEQVGEQIARQIGERLGLPPAVTERLARLVALHMLPVWYPTRQEPPSVLYEMFAAAKDLAPELLLLSLADVGSALGPAQPEYRLHEQKQFVTEMLEEYFTQGFLKTPNLPVSATDLEMELGLTEEKTRERLLSRLTCDYVDGEFQGREDGLAWACELMDSAALKG